MTPQARRRQTLIIECRAKVVDDCLDGEPFERQMPDHEEGMREDGTFDGETIVCDPCYVALMPFTPSGVARNDELPAAIETYRTNLDYIRSCNDPEGELRDARRAVKASRIGSSRYVSAMACITMAEAEIERRAKS